MPTGSDTYEGHKAFAIAMTYGLPVREVRHVYSVDDGRLTGPQWVMTFRTADHEVTSPETLPGIKVCSAEQRRRTPVAFAEFLLGIAAGCAPPKRSEE